ncbi:HlyD family secretion protein [Anaeromyxobacter sp. Fw109-5]|uniref:HlyD family secretion protein n=1 Tax=Anaeromyxobacter sp. (strain Fw109-5) TaxID=404589 RepID=UPI0000ED814F|nr:HlyD family efflux transporter periplasmic adaptor subunit [Anaeromyxobacter sp. Fw109-5]ABS25101.1 secretion protein HlyD family protein [Anaeromyxobacter sp. Fw109-5]
MRRVVAVLVVLTVVLGGLIALRLWTQARALAAPSGGSGEIEGIDVDLSSRVGARILEIRVREGDPVKAGDLLVRLDCADPAAQLAEATARLEAARAQAIAAGAQIQASRRARTAAGASEEAARAQAAALGAQAEAAARQAKRLEALPQDVPASSIDQTRASASGLEHQTAAAKAQALASAAQARAADVGIRSASAQAEAATAQMRAAEAAVERAKILVGECDVRAPRDAEVATLPHEAGELVSPGAILARLVDLSEVTATFYLPNAEVGAVKPGARAVIVADAFPEERFEGTIRTVALEAEFTPRNIQTRTDRDRLVYPVEVTVKNRGGKLRAGMPVQVTLDEGKRQ